MKNAFWQVLLLGLFCCVLVCLRVGDRYGASPASLAIGFLGGIFVLKLLAWRVMTGRLRRRGPALTARGTLQDAAGSTSRVLWHGLGWFVPLAAAAVALLGICRLGFDLTTAVLVGLGIILGADAAADAAAELFLGKSSP